MSAPGRDRGGELDVGFVVVVSECGGLVGGCGRALRSTDVLGKGLEDPGYRKSGGS